MPLIPTDGNLPRTIDELSGAARFCAETALHLYSITLDFSPDSLDLVDSIIESIRHEGQGLEDVRNTLVLFGAYYGEVIVESGAGTWLVSHELGDGVDLPQPLVQLASGETVDPFAQTLKRYLHGEQDGVAQQYRQLAADSADAALAHRGWFKRLLGGK